MRLIMKNELTIKRCKSCGAIIKIIEDCNCEGCGIICCGEPMEVLKPNSVDAAVEKHVPVLESNGSKIKVTVGSTLHPMLEEHYIQFVQTVSEDGSCFILKFFKPGDSPVMNISDFPSVKSAVAYCNIHGLWIGDK